ncbi:MAG: chemotaxis protein CheX [Planctomycetota bacterium]
MSAAELSAQVVGEAVELLFDTALGMSVSDVQPGMPEARDEDRVTAAVAVQGAWGGHVVLSCGRRLAEHMSARFLAAAGVDDPPSAQDTLDALGELANILAGQLKSSLPGPTTLGAPRVTGLGGTSYFARGAEPRVTLSCRVGQGLAVVQVLERVGRARG